MKSTVCTIAAASTLALLSACGGGGGGSTEPVTPQGLHITADNQQSVARASVTGGLSVANIETATNAGGSAAQPTDVAGRAHTLSLVLKRALAAGVKSRVAGASAHPATTHGATVACGVSGSVTTSFDDADNNGMLSSGDVVSVAFDQCKDSATSLFNGTAVISLGNLSATQISANFDFQNVTSVEGALTSTIQGGVAVSETDSDTDSTTTMTFVSQMAITLASASYNDQLLIDGGTHIVIDQQIAAGRTSVSFDGVLRAQSLTVAAAVTLQTLSPLVQLDADAFPSSGVIKARGDKGTLLMTVQSATTVQLQLDANDDGTYESTQTVAWSALVP